MGGGYPGSSVTAPEAQDIETNSHRLDPKGPQQRRSRHCGDRPANESFSYSTSKHQPRIVAGPLHRLARAGQLARSCSISTERAKFISRLQADQPPLPEPRSLPIASVNRTKRQAAHRDEARATQAAQGNKTPKAGDL